MATSATSATCKKRQGYKLQITNEMKRVEGMLDGTEEVDRAVMKRVGLKIKNYLDIIIQLDNAVLEETTDGAAIDKEVGLQQSYHSKTLESLLLIQEHAEPSVTVYNPNDTMVSSETNESRSVRLPKLEIPTFCGDYLEWQSFYDIFKNTIHNNEKLTKVEKFSYLKGSLGGEALVMVQGYQLTDRNYAEALAVLQDRFGDTQRAKFGHFEALVAIQPATLDSKDLVRVFYECERHIRSLVALGLEEQDFSVAFVPIILAKLPSEVKREVWSKNGDTEWTMVNLRTYMKAVITARERGDAQFTGLSELAAKPETRKSGKGFEKNVKGSASMLVAPSGFKKQKPIRKSGRKCRYCEQAHYSDQCLRYPDADSRKNWLREHNLCYSCLDSGHGTSNCPNPRKCAHCDRIGHHRSLCYDKFGRRTPRLPKVIPPKEKGEKENTLLNPEAEDFVPSGTVAVAPVQKEVRGNATIAFLPTALATLANVAGSHHVNGRILLDTASSRTFITQALCKRLKLLTLEQSYSSVGRFGTARRQTSVNKLVQICVKCADGAVKTVIAKVTPVICAPVERMPIDLKRFPVVKQLKMAEPLNKEADELPVDMLIGTDYYYRFVLPKEVVSCEGGLDLVSSRFGFLTAGAVEVENSIVENTVTLLLTESAPGKRDPWDKYGIERFWQIEDVGTKNRAIDDVSDEKALSNFYQTLRFENGRYWVTWPWKTQNPDLADNKQLAFARLKSVYSRLQKDPSVLKAYNDTIQKQFAVGVVEVAPEVPTGPVYYIPHHEVITPMKSTTKLRVVYDASSKAKKEDLSLNDCLHRGMVVLEDLCGLLLRFRTHKIGIVADIEKAFLQVGLQESQRDVARFFWVRDHHKPLTPDNIVVFRFTRVFFGAVASPSLLGCTLDAHARSVESTAKDSVVRDIAKQFRENTYTDNHVSGSSDVKCAVRHCQEARKLCQGASMNLREFYTNSPVVREKLLEESRGKNVVTKVLGVTWDTNGDWLSCCKLKSGVVGSGVPTKRSITREAAQTFDPLGWLAPVTVVAKLLVQELWKKGLDWDKPVPQPIASRWLKVRGELEQLADIKVPRYLGLDRSRGSHELHVFCDASLNVSAAAVYLRTEVGGKALAVLLFSKTRLAPIEPKQTIPRLELVAVELGVNLIQFVEKQLRLTIGRKVVWSDSQCVLQWLKSAKLTTRFVQKRVANVNEVQGLEHRYVASADNPADLPSRGCVVSNLKQSELWWHGPSWLVHQSDAWPPLYPALSDRLDIQAVTVATTTDVKPAAGYLIPLEKYSKLSKLLRVTALVQRAVWNFRMKQHKADRRVGWITLKELSSARMFWEHAVQQESFPEESNWNKTSPIRQLNVYYDADGLIRCKSRLAHAELPLRAIDPVLLPKGHLFTNLVVMHSHERLLHAGASQVVTELRKQYWVIHALSQAKKAIRECRKCRRVEGGAFSAPPPPALPEIRVREQKPFAHTGLDYLGPLLVKLPTAKKDTETSKKVWICIFTCALVRSIHLEVVENQAADEFHLALRRFFALYGAPKVIISDNAGTFITVETAMKRMEKETAADKSLAEFLLNYNIEWKKIPQAAPWMGGFYERMVGLVKRFLKKALDGKRVTLPELRTVVAEITEVVNSRPLLHVSGENEDYSLTPADFLGKSQIPGFPTYKESERRQPQSTVDNVVATWKRLQAISRNFWDMWKSAYLTSLREKYSNAVQRNPSLLLPSVGAVVQIKDKMPRGQWRLGKVIKLVESRDCKVRSVELVLANGKTINRPIRLLYPLEMGPSGNLPANAAQTQGVVASGQQ